MSEALPEPAPAADVPSAWVVCPWCGALAPDLAVHRDYHQKLVTRARRGEDVVVALLARVEALETALRQRTGA